MTNIFVAKLDFGVSDEALKSLFENYGTVVKCHVAKDRETGKPRGFAFVEMGSAEEAQAAIRGLDGHAMNGRNMVVKLAEDRNAGGNKPRSSGPPRDGERSFNRDSRPAHRDSRPPRDENSDSRPPRSDDFRAPLPPDDDSTDSDSAEDKAAKRSKVKKKKTGEKPENREFKMSAYKKSGKKPRVQFEEDDDDWELELLKQKRRGWSEDDDM